MRHLLRRTWAEINLDNIKSNYKSIKNIVDKNTKVMAVVKADAYGHGDVICANALSEAGADWFGVSNIEEAISLRQGGVSGDILIFGFTPYDMINAIEKWGFTQAIFSLEYGKKLQEHAKKLNVKINCHLKIDTGMGRIGILCNKESEVKNAVKDIEKIFEYKNLNFTGIFTHFAASDEKNEDAINYTKNQFNIFVNLCKILEKSGIDLGIKHCCNSAATMEYKEMHLDMVRAGDILYGLKPSKEVGENLDLKIAMVLKSTIAMIKEEEQGNYISYNRTFKTGKKTKIATIPIGYADGYSRKLSNMGKVAINGKLAPIVGNICMDQTMLDVTNIDVRVLDTVTIFGDEKSLVTANDVAGWAETINYEVITVLGKRVPRLYIKDNEEVIVTNYNNVEW